MCYDDLMVQTQGNGTTKGSLWSCHHDAEQSATIGMIGNKSWWKSMITQQLLILDVMKPYEGWNKLARDETMDCQLHQRMCNLPTKQNLDPLPQNSAILHTDLTRCQTLPTSCYGFNHGPSSTGWKRHNPHNCQPWVLMCCYILALQYYHNGWSSGAALSWSPLPMVRTTPKDHQWLRSPLYITLLVINDGTTPYSAKPQYSKSPTNGQVIQMCKPMD